MVLNEVFSCIQPLWTTKYTTHVMQTSKQFQLASSLVRPSFLYHLSLIIYPTTSESLWSTFLYSLSYAILQPLPLRQKMYCITKKNLTFLGLSKITPSAISRVILAYRRADETIQNISKATRTWTVNRQNKTKKKLCIQSASKQLILAKTPEFPHIRLSTVLLILVVYYAKKKNA